MDVEEIMRRGALNLFELNWRNKCIAVLGGEMPYLEISTAGNRVVKAGRLNDRPSLILLDGDKGLLFEEKCPTPCYYLAVAETRFGSDVSPYQWFNYAGQENMRQIRTLLATYPNRESCMSVLNEITKSELH